MNRLILSGASGFVGASIISSFKSKYKVLTIGRNQADYCWDRLDNLEEEHAEAFIHLAAIAQDDKNGDIAAFEKVNVGLTKQLFGVFLKSKASLFIHFSSAKAAADHTHGTLTEEAQPNPKTAYGQSKLKAEEYLLAQKLPKGKKLVILRPTMIHGPGNSGSLLQLYKFVNKGIPYPFAAYHNQRSFLAIDNLLEGIKAIIESENIASGVYNVCDDQVLSTNQLIQLIAEASGKKAKLLKVPPFIFNSLAKLGDVLHLPFNSHIMAKLTSDYVVSNEKMKSALGWKQMPVESKQGILKTVSAFHSVK